jgi:hypothetical protein
VADNDHDAVPEALAVLETLFDEGGTDPEALEVLVDGKGGQGERCSFRGIRDDGNGRKQDMTDNPVAGLRHEREFVVIVAICTESIDEPCLAVLPERLEIDFKNCVDIFGTFRPDNK